MEKVNLTELKEKFKKNHPKETEILYEKTATTFWFEASCVWKGYKDAFKELGLLEED